MIDRDGEREIPVCADPECDNAGIEVASTGDGTTWWCEECDSRFNEPRYRAPRTDTGVRESTVAGRLLAADPAEVAADE